MQHITKFCRRKLSGKLLLTYESMGRQFDDQLSINPYAILTCWVTRPKKAQEADIGWKTSLGKSEFNNFDSCKAS